MLTSTLNLYMKKLIVALCCIVTFQAASAQQIIKLDIDSTTFAYKLVVPNLRNMEKLLGASQKDYVATVLSLDYALSKIDTEYYAPKTTIDNSIFGISKDDQSVTIVFYQTTTYPKQMKDNFLAQYKNLTHKKVKGSDAYYFKDDDGKGVEKLFVMIFDTPKKDGGFITITTADE